MLFSDEQVLKRNASRATARMTGVMDDQPAMLVMRDMGVRMLGIDERPAWRRWGGTPRFLVFVVLKGTLYYRSPGGAALQAQRGEALLLPADLSKQVESHEEPVEVLWVQLMPDGALLKALAPPAHAHVRLFPPTNVVRAAALALYAERVGQHPDSSEACALLLRTVFHYLQRHLSSHEASRDQAFREALSQILREVHALPGGNWSVTALATRLHMSTGHLHRMTRRLYAASPASIIQQIRLDKAAELLQTTDLKIEAIAAEVGYSNSYSLSSAFLHSKGVRPGEFRKSFRV